MRKYKVNGLTPFLPGKDFQLSKSFYGDLGFVAVAEIENAILFELDGYGFWLQDYYVKDYAENYMLCFYVSDIHDWWASAKGVFEKSEYFDFVKVFSEPHEQEGAMMMQFSDPSSVLWHVRES